MLTTVSHLLRWSTGGHPMDRADFVWADYSWTTTAVFDPRTSRTATTPVRYAPEGRDDEPLNDAEIASVAWTVDHLAEFRDALGPAVPSYYQDLDSEERMRTLFERWVGGAEKMPARSPKVPEVYKLPDGSVIQWRTSSGSGGATIDIFTAEGVHNKVHLPLP